MKKFTQIDGMSYAEKIEYFANSTNMVSANNGNHKTGKGCLTLSFPTCSCRPDSPCLLAGTCYCLKGNQRWPAVLGAYYRNWRIWNENPKRFEEQVNALITFNGLLKFRWCDAGDLPDKAFLEMAIRIAQKHKDVHFLAYTKKYEMANEVLDEQDLPENFTLRFSMWDKSWRVPNPHNLPCAWVRFNKQELNPAIPENAFLCKGGKETTCSACGACFSKKVQHVVFNQH